MALTPPRADRSVHAKMDVKKAVWDQFAKVLQDPRVMQLAMNPKVMGAVMRAMSVRGRVASSLGSAQHAVARTLNLASRDEVRELRRTVRRLEEQLGRMDAERDDPGSLDDSE